MVDAVPDAVFVADDDRRYVEVNAAACELLGLTREDLLTRRIDDLVPAGDPLDLWHRLQRDGRAEGERVMRRADGSEIYVQQRAFANVLPGRHMSILRDLTAQRTAERERAAVEQALRDVVAHDITRHKEAEEREAAAKESLRGLLTQAPAVICVLRGPDHRFELANPAALRILGRSDVVGLPFDEVVRDMPSHERERLDRVYATGEAFTERARPVSRGGDGSGERETRYFDLVAQPMRGPGNRIEGVIVLGIDVTESVRARRELEAHAGELRNQQAWLEAILDRMPMPLLLVEPGSARVIFSNKAADDLAGGDFPKGTPGADYHHVYYCTDASGQRIPDEQMPGVRAARGETLRDFEMDWHTPGGRRSLLCYTDTVPALHGHPPIAILPFVDVTRLKRAEAMQKLMADASAVLSASLDFDQTLEAVARLAVGPLADACAIDLIDEQGELRSGTLATTHPEQGTIFADLRARFPPLALKHPGVAALREGRTALWREVSEDVLRSLATNEEHFEQMRAVGLRTRIVVPLIARSRLVGALAITRGGEGCVLFDEDDVVVAEELARRAALAIDNARLYREAQEAKTAAEQANRTKDEFLATMSHELRTPLNAILGWTSILRSRVLEPAHVERALATIDRNAQAQSRLVNDVLDVSSIVNGKLRLEVQPVDVEAVIAASVDVMRPAAEAKGVVLRLDVDRPLGTIVADPDRLQQVCWNLVSNAVKFTKRDGHVEVRASRGERELRIEVTDSGQGIAPELLPLVFERFRQADSSTTRAHGGLGLGLAIVRHLVELHGGTVIAESEGEGRGARFIVNLPARESAPAAEPLVRRGRTALPATTSGLPLSAPLDGLRVLVVDDNEDARVLLDEILASRGATVVAAASARTALETLRQSPPDVLVADIGMPGVDGYALMRSVRALPAAEGGRTPAVALTAYAREEDRRRAFGAGFQVHVAKPVDPDELVAVVANLGGRTALDR